MLIRNAEVDGHRVDLRCRGGVIDEIAKQLSPLRGEHDLDARGGALLPGLHDHHLHLFSLAASLDSIACGPPQINTREALIESLRKADSAEGWLRGTGYFESVAGPLDRTRMDALCVHRPLRIQHRNGAIWFLNSRAIEALGPDLADSPVGVERDAAGRLTGRIVRADAWLRDRLPLRAAPSLSEAGSLLARYGVTRITDATPSNGRAEVALFHAAQRSGALPQRLRLMGDLSLRLDDESDTLEIAEYKILLDDPALPEFDELVSGICEAHQARRSVAIHAVTRTEIHFALAAFEAAKTRPGDRLEHASVAPREAMELTARLGLRVVTQPNFVSERGDDYRIEVEKQDLPHLYRVRSWLEAEVPLAAGTDAPFGDPDPWRAMQAAVTRSTRSGQTLGIDELISPESAVALFFDSFSTAPGRDFPASSLAVGQRADLCLLDTPWREVRQNLSSDRVAATLCGGEILWSAIA